MLSEQLISPKTIKSESSLLFSRLLLPSINVFTVPCGARYKPSIEVFYPSSSISVRSASVEQKFAFLSMGIFKFGLL